MWSILAWSDWKWGCSLGENIWKSREGKMVSCQMPLFLLGCHQAGLQAAMGQGHLLENRPEFSNQRYLVFSWRQTSRSPACNGKIYITIQRSIQKLWTDLHSNSVEFIIFELFYLWHAGRLSNYSGATKCIWGRAKIRILISGFLSPRLSSLHYVVFTDNI